jgi:hypothetical protein
MAPWTRYLGPTIPLIKWVAIPIWLYLQRNLNQIIIYQVHQPSNQVRHILQLDPYLTLFYHTYGT